MDEPGTADIVRQDGQTTVLNAAPRGFATTKKLVTDGDPDAHPWIPSEGDFEALGDDYHTDGHLDAVASRLIAARFMAARQANVLYRWKAAGGKTNGRLTFGKCVKLSGHAKHFAQADYLIWVAADHCLGADFTEWELEALLAHELDHIEIDEDKDGNPVYRVRGHDAELFVSEVRNYGFWRRDIERVARVVAQVPLELQ